MIPVYSSVNSTTCKMFYDTKTSLSYGTGSFDGYVAEDRFCFEPNQACFEEPLKFGAAYNTT